MSYDSRDVAKYVVRVCNDNGTPISNLQLQKILYYVQGSFFAKFGRPAFYNDIVAWRHGPVVPEVYYMYNHNVAKKIKENYDEYVIPNAPDEDLKLIEETALEKAELDAWMLVAATHAERPWKVTYNTPTEGAGEDEVISTVLIEEFFTGECKN